MAISNCVFTQEYLRYRTFHVSSRHLLNKIERAGKLSVEDLVEKARTQISIGLYNIATFIQDCVFSWAHPIYVCLQYRLYLLQNCKFYSTDWPNRISVRTIKWMSLLFLGQKKFFFLLCISCNINI